MPLYRAKNGHFTNRRTGRRVATHHRRHRRKR